MSLNIQVRFFLGERVTQNTSENSLLPLLTKDNFKGIGRNDDVLTYKKGLVLRNKNTEPTRLPELLGHRHASRDL